MDGHDMISTACTIEWGSVAQFVTAAVLAFGLFFTWHQLRLGRRTRDTEDRIAISQRMLDHNMLVISDKLTLSAVASLEGLHVPADSQEAQVYWAFRAVHLSHINLIWKVWELGGTPRAGKNLKVGYQGWQRFARQIVAMKLHEAAHATAEDAKKPDVMAGADVWKGLEATSGYEAVPPKFAAWLYWLATPIERVGETQS